ncbi:MAG: hypothetical protein ACR2GY_11070 [Phycisphaerales bacterium]
MIEVAHLDDAQRVAIERLYEEYLTASLTLDEAAISAMNNAGLPELDHIFEELPFILADENRRTERDERHARIKELHFAVYTARHRFLDRADATVDTFFAGCEFAAGVAPDQRRAMERWLRRHVYLRSYAANSYNRLSCDLHALFHDVFGPGGELHNIVLPAELQEQLDHALLRYDESIDLLIRSRMREWRQPPVFGNGVRTRSEPEYWELKKDDASRTKQLWGVHHRFIQSVQRLVEEVDPAAAERWQRTVRAELCPALYRDFPTIHIIDWLRQQSLNPLELDRFEELHDRFMAAHDRLLNRAFEAGLNASFEAGSRYGGDQTHPLSLGYVESLFAIHERGAEYLVQVRGMLHPDLHEAFRQQFARAKGSSLWLGPDIMYHTALSELGHLDRYNQNQIGSVSRLNHFLRNCSEAAT